MNEGDLFAILIGGDPFQLVLTLWERDLGIALEITRPATTAAAAMAVYIPSNTWPGYGSDSDNDKESYFNESFKPGAYDDCQKGATATDGAAYNGTLLPPTAPEYGNYEPPYYRPPVSSESSKTKRP